MALNFCQRQSQNPAHTVTGPDLASLTTTIHSPVQWLGFLSHRSGTPSDTPHPRFRDVAIAGAEVIFQIWNGGFHGRCFIREEIKKSPQELHSVGGVCFGVQFTSKHSTLKCVSDGKIRNVEMKIFARHFGKTDTFQSRRFHKACYPGGSQVCCSS